MNKFKITLLLLIIVSLSLLVVSKEKQIEPPLSVKIEQYYNLLEEAHKRGIDTSKAEDFFAQYKTAKESGFPLVAEGMVDKALKELILSLAREEANTATPSPSASPSPFVNQYLTFLKEGVTVIKSFNSGEIDILKLREELKTLIGENKINFILIEQGELKLEDYFKLVKIVKSLLKELNFSGKLFIQEEIY